MSCAQRILAVSLILAFLSTGAATAELDWQAQWIAGEGEQLPLLRKTFTVQDKPIQSATAYVCGLGHFELFLNGAKCGDHFLDPGWTNYRKTCLYVPFDVKDMLQPGANAFGVMLGNGMYNVTGGRYTKFTGSFGEPKLILQLEISYADGSTETVVSDDSWRSMRGPITFTCIYGGEDYDARLEQPGWSTAAFDDSPWQGVRIVEGPGGVLREQDAPPITVAQSLPAVAIKKLDDAKYRAELEWNVSARPYLKVKGKSGQSVKIEVGELPDTPWEGHSYTYTLKGQGEEIFRPQFTYFGFQYLFVHGADLPEDAAAIARPVLLEIGADFITSSARQVGSFQCDNVLFNDIDAMIGRSVRSNLQSVLTDCPHREKLGWLEVSHLMAPSIAYHFDVSKLYRKICRDTTESQLDNGLVPDIAPEYTRFTGGFFESAEWGSASVQLPWFLYRWYGDRDILAQQYDTMARYTRYLATTRNKKGLAKGGLGDWYDWTPEKGHAGPAQLTPIELTATAMLYDNARILAQVSGMLGKANEEEEFAALAEQVRSDFIEAYYNAKKHIVSTGSQSALAVGLYFGLVPEADRAAVLEKLVHAVESMEYRPTVGEVCFRFLLLSLAEGGRSDVINRILDRTDPPGYGNMLRNFGLKTLSEQWDKPGSSLNHCMFGQAQEWFQAYLIGIRQAEDSVGFERLVIAPTPVGKVNAASGYFDGPRGRIEVAWTRDGETFELKVTIPADSTAEVFFSPVAGPVILESGKAADWKETDAGRIVTVGPGTYHFTCSSS
jgi:hypothetical protein